MTSTDLSQFKKTVGTWVTDYDICQFKHEVVVDCYKASQTPTKPVKQQDEKDEPISNTNW